MFGNSVGILVFEIIKKIKPRGRGRALASAARPDWFCWLSVHVQCVITALDCFSNIRHHLQYCTFVFEGLDYGHSSLYSGK